MAESASLIDFFNGILVSGEYGQLEPYRDPNRWTALGANERTILAKLFTHHAAELFQQSKKEKEALSTLGLATQAAPEDTKLLIRQAKIIYEATSSEEALKSAIGLLDKVVQIDKECFQAWELWASILYELSHFSEEMGELDDILSKFSTAQSLWVKEFDPTGLFFDQWAIRWSIIGDISGEAVDLHLACALFRKSLELDRNKGAELYNSYGNTLVSLGMLVVNKDNLKEAVNCYEESVLRDGEFFDAWMNLACTAGYLVEIWQEITYYEIAENALKKAAELCDEEPALWFKWGHIQSYMAQSIGDLELMKSSAEKFAKADQCGSNYSFILWEWATALLYIGAAEENLEILHKALEKVSKSIELDPKDPMAYYTSGLVQLELGNYFGEESHYHQSIEMLQEGLKVDDSIPYLWYGLGLAYTQLGEIREEISYLEEAIQFYSRTQEFGGQMGIQFWHDWGELYMKLGQMTGRKGYIRKALEAYEHMMNFFQSEESEEIIGPAYMHSYANAWDELGEEENHLPYIEKAIELYLQILLIDSEYYPARLSLGMAYAHLAAQKSDIVTYYRAVDNFEIYSEYDNEDENLWIEWGRVLLYMAHMTDDPAHLELSQLCTQDAEQKFLTAASLGATHAYNLLACLYILKHNCPLALSYLEKAHDAGLPIDQEFLLSEQSFGELRNTPGFEEFIERIK